MSVHVFHKMSLQDLANYFKESYNKQKLKTLNVVEVRNIYESLQYLAKQQKQLKHSSKITKEDDSKKIMPKGEALVDYQKIFQLMDSGQQIQPKQLRKYKMDGIMDFYEKNREKLLAINNKIEQQTKEDHYFWQTVTICVNQTFEKLTQDNKQSKFKQSSVRESKKEPNKFLHQISNEQTIALKVIQQYLIQGENTEKYKSNMKVIASKNNLPTNILEIIQKQYVIWYKVLNDLYPVFYETKPKYQEIHGKTLAEKCSWLSGEIATKIENKSKYLIQQLGIQRKNSYNLNQLFELFQEEKNNMTERLQKLFVDVQNAKQSPKKSENQNIEKQKKFVKASNLTYGIISPKAKPTNLSKRQEVKQLKQKQQPKKQNQKRISALQGQIQRQKNQINQYIEQKRQNNKIISDLNEKIYSIQKDNKEKVEQIKKIYQQNRKIVEQSEQKIKKLQKQQKKGRQKYKQTQQFLQNWRKLMQQKQKATFVKIYHKFEEQNKKMQIIFNKIYQMYKNQNPGMQYIIDDYNSLDQKYKFIKQYLKIDNKLNPNPNPNKSSIRSDKPPRKPSNNQSEWHFQNLSVEQQEQLKGKGSKDFRKQSTDMITQSYKVNRSSMGGTINKSEYSAEQEDSSRTQKLKQENYKLENEIKKLQKQLSQKDSQIQRISNDLKSNSLKTQQLQKHSPKYFKQTLFYSGMFQQILKQRFIIDTLQAYFKNNSITNFNLLHRNIDPTDLITDIQKHPNILFLGLTKSGHTIAAYSSLSACNTINTKQPKGIIMLTKSQECQQLKPKQKSIEKDSKHLTFNIGDITLKINITKEQQQPLILYFQTDNKQLMKKQKDQSHKQIRQSTNQTKIELQAYQIYEIKFNENNLAEEKKELQTIQVKSNILQQDRSRSSMIMDEMKSVNKKVPSQAQQIRQLKLTVQRYEKSIKTLKQQNDELKGVGGNISQSYNKRSNIRQQSKGKISFNQSSSLINKRLAINLTLNSQKNQRVTEKAVDKNQQELTIMNKKYKEQGQALKSLELKLKTESMKSNRLQNDKKQLQAKMQKQKQLEQQNKKLENQTKQLYSKLKTKQEQINKLLKERQSQRNQQSNTEEIYKIRLEVSEIKKLLQIEKRKYQIKQQQVKKIQIQLAKKEKQLSNTQKQIQMLQEEIKSINKNNSIQKQNRLAQTEKSENKEQIELKQKLGRQLQKKKQEIQQLQNKIHQLQQTNGSLNEQIKIKQVKINQLIKDQKLKQTRVKLLQAQASQLNSKIVAMKKETVIPKQQPIVQIKSTPKDKQQSKEQLQKQKQLLQRIRKQRQQIQTQIINKQKFFREMGQKQKRLCANMKQLEQKSSKMGEQFQKAQKVVQNMDKLQQEKQKLQESIKNLHEHMSMLISQQKNKQEKLKQSEYRLNLIKKQLSEQISQKAKLQTLKKSIKQKQLQLVQKDNLIASIQNKIRQAKKTLSQYENDSQIKQKILNDKLNKIEDQIKFNQAKLKSLQTKILSKIQGDHSVVGFHQYFVGEIVQNNPDRHYIISQVQNIMCKQIKRTKLLYTYPLMNIINPHIPLDGIPNYIVLIKMRQRNKEGKKFTIAMFSEKALEKSNIINNKRGFICSVTNRQVFYLVKSPTNNPRVTEYNEFYIVFGNNQIIFRINSPLLQFKIGHNFKSFDTGAMKTGEIFTGSNQQKSEMEGYQIYQVMF